MSTKQKTLDLFKGKKITVMGLGLLGGALNDTIFLAENGADLTVTDIKTAEQLKTSIDKLKKYKGIKYVLGGHQLEDFREADMILQPGNVPLNSPYLAEAKKNKIPIFVSESLFVKYVEGVKLIGITGTRGKSTTAQLVYEILTLRQSQNKKIGKAFLAGNVKNVSTLALLNKVKLGDIVVLELDSWALHGLGDIKQSPHIAVFTNFMVDHQNFYGSTPLTTSKDGMELYFADKANIFLNQKPEDYLVVGAEVLKIIQKKYKKQLVKKISPENIVERSGGVITPDVGVVPKSWKVRLLGEHNRQNIAYAVTVARILDVPEKIIKKSVEDFKGVSGRLEFVKEVKGVRFYNDTTATTPEACFEALKALTRSLKSGGGIVLISGGTDKMLDFRQYGKEVPKMVKTLILFKGTATDKILSQLKIKSDKLKIGEVVDMAQMGILKNVSLVIVDSMKMAMVWVQKFSVKNDVVLLSPGSASFGIFKNEFDRGDQFSNLVKK